MVPYHKRRFKRNTHRHHDQTWHRERGGGVEGEVVVVVGGELWLSRFLASPDRSTHTEGLLSCQNKWRFIKAQTSEARRGYKSDEQPAWPTVTHSHPDRTGQKKGGLVVKSEQPRGLPKQPAAGDTLYSFPLLGSISGEIFS